MADNQDKASAIKERINAAIQSDIPNINFNSIVTSVGTADVTVVLERNGRPVAVLNASYTAAKTLSVMLGNAIAQLEEVSGHPIMTTTEVEQFIVKREEKLADANAKKEAKPTPKKVRH